MSSKARQHKSREPDSNWEHALARELRQRWKCYRKALRRCQRNFSEKSIHASRIEARRLASHLELLQNYVPRTALEEGQSSIKQHLDAFDPLRDAQVQLVILKKECGATQGAKLIRKWLTKRARRCRKRAERRVCQFKSRRIRDTVKLLLKRLEEGDHRPEKRRARFESVMRMIESAFARVVKCRQRMDRTHPETIHRTRIAFKKFRYMVESSRCMLPGITAARLQAMKRFQDLLGNLQDVDVFLARLDKIILKGAFKASEVSAVRAQLLRRRARLLDLSIRQADVVDTFWPVRSAGGNEHSKRVRPRSAASKRVARRHRGTTKAAHKAPPVSTDSRPPGQVSSTMDAAQNALNAGKNGSQIPESQPPPVASGIDAKQAEVQA